MTVRKYIRSRSLSKQLLFLIKLILIPCLVNGQELPKAFKEFELDNPIMSLLLEEIELINEIPKGDFIIINYSEDRDQIKMAVFDKYDFIETLVSFEKKIIGIASCGSKTFAFIGDAGIFLKDVHKNIKIDNYTRYFTCTNRLRIKAAKKQGLIYFPTTKDPLSAFFNLDGEKVTYLRSELIFVVDDNWIQ
ncbi:MULTISPECIES: hypothetical protein [Sphingobacterium]|uniref:Uncharacterized protein n=1 Tax=Sphingobacterium populi TaxID=1812824 RepID=A0ABW5UFL8_9SPHI|nr:hypothetical protein [Sphingobacterium sp. CFCC 11742]